MAKLPIDLLHTGTLIGAHVRRATGIANSTQSEFAFADCSDSALIDWWALSQRSEINTTEVFDNISSQRLSSRGYQPFIVAFTDAYLVGNRFANLFGSHRAEAGLAIVTFFEIDDLLGSDDDAKVGYALYYFARYAMSFISPSIKNHDETRQCLYDRKVKKVEIIQSIRSGALCDRCRRAILESGKGTHKQMDAVNSLLEHASSLVHKTSLKRRANVFIGSSSKHVAYARAFKELLEPQFAIQVWDEDQVFRLGSATIEQLEQHVSYYDFGVFFMFPDDRIERGAGTFLGPRDNVVFEAGLFTGKLSRFRTIIVTTLGHQVTLPSDLHGLTTLQINYDDPPREALLAAAGRASEHIKRVFGGRMA